MKSKKLIRIEAKPKNGVHRAGMFHPAEPKDYLLSGFTKDQIAAIKAEKKLIVTEYEGELPKEAMTEAEIIEAEKIELSLKIGDLATEITSLKKRITSLEKENKKLVSQAKTAADSKSSKTDGNPAGK